MPIKIEKSKTKKGKYWVRYIAGNGKILATSELLNSRKSAEKNISAMKKIITRRLS